MYFKAGVTADKWKHLRRNLEKHKVILDLKVRYYYPLIIGSFVIFVTINSSEWINLSISMIVLSTWIIFQSYCLKVHKRELTKNTSSLKITSDGLLVKNENFEGKLEWSYFNKLINDSHYFFLFEKDRLMPLVLDKDLLSCEESTIIENSVMISTG